MHKFPIEQPESRHVYYEEPVQPPKFVRYEYKLGKGVLGTAGPSVGSRSVLVGSRGALGGVCGSDILLKPTVPLSKDI